MSLLYSIPSFLSKCNWSDWTNIDQDNFLKILKLKSGIPSRGTITPASYCFFVLFMFLKEPLTILSCHFCHTFNHIGYMKINPFLQLVCTYVKMTWRANPEFPLNHRNAGVTGGSPYRIIPTHVPTASNSGGLAPPARKLGYNLISYNWSSVRIDWGL